MKTLNAALATVTLMLIGCASTAMKSPDVSESIRKSLDAVSLRDVSVSADRDKGVVTLGGHVTSDGEKAQAESLAKSLAGSQVVANEIAVTPPGAEKEAKQINSDLDKAIEKNLDAALIQKSMLKGVTFAANNGVVTLSGEVDSQAKRASVQKRAEAIVNVKQVVNDLQTSRRLV